MTDETDGGVVEAEAEDGWIVQAATGNPPPGGAGGRPDEASFRAQAAMMRRAFVGSPVRNVLLLISFGIFALIVATAFGQVLLNRWNQPFYDAIEKRNLSGFLSGRGLFIEGFFARLAYRSLYAMHQTALHGYARTALSTLGRAITRRTEPRVKLH